MIWPNGCSNEDRRGRRCCWGLRHRGACRFTGLAGAGIDGDRLELLAACAVKPIERFGGGGSAARWLEARGLIRRMPIGMRWWCLGITKHGMDVLKEIR